MLSKCEGFNFGLEIKNATNDKSLLFIARYLLLFWT